jgi:signal transduction histidine kinase
MNITDWTPVHHADQGATASLPHDTCRRRPAVRARARRPIPYAEAGLAPRLVAVGTRAALGYRQVRGRLGLRLIVELVTRAQQAEAALIREQDRLHELRATMVGISLSRSLLGDRDRALSEETRVRLNLVHDSELGRLERILADDEPRQAEMVDLGEVVDPLVEALRLRGRCVRWAGTRERAWGHRDHVAEIIHVLLENAARHGGPGEIHVEVTGREDTVEVHVRDQGPGVAPELAHRVFERGARAADSPGQGIGLNIARRLTQEMAGHLRLEPGVAAPGARFVLSLPVREASRCRDLSD